MSYLKTTRLVQVKLFEYEGNKYVRMRELAYLLGIKQPFEFTRTIKQHSESAILKGVTTKDFRDDIDNNTTIFVNLKELYAFLLDGERVHRLLLPIREMLILELQQIFKGEN